MQKLFNTLACFAFTPGLIDIHTQLAYHLLRYQGKDHHAISTISWQSIFVLFEQLQAKDNHNLILGIFKCFSSLETDSAITYNGWQAHPNLFGSSLTTKDGPTTSPLPS